MSRYIYVMMVSFKKPWTLRLLFSLPQAIKITVSLAAVVRVGPKLAPHQRQSHQRLLTRTTHSNEPIRLDNLSLLKLNAGLSEQTRRALLCKTCLIES